MDQAEAQKFTPLAEWVVTESARLQLSASADFSQRAARLREEIASEQSALAARFDTRIQQLITGDIVAEQKEAQTLLAVALSEEDLSPKRRAKLQEWQRAADERVPQLTRKQKESELSDRLTQLDERLQQATDSDALAGVISDLDSLADDARQAGYSNIATEAQRSSTEAGRHKGNLAKLTSQLAAVEASLTSAETIASNQGSREAQLFILQDARRSLAEMEQKSVKSPAVMEWARKVDQKWKDLDGPKWEREQAAQSAREKSQELDATAPNRPEHTRPWLTYALSGLLLLAVLGSTYFLLSRFANQQARLNGLDSNIGTLNNNVSALTDEAKRMIQQSPSINSDDLTNKLDNISKQITELPDQINMEPTTQSNLDPQIIATNVIARLQSDIDNIVKRSDLLQVTESISTGNRLLATQNIMINEIISTVQNITNTIDSLDTRVENLKSTIPSAAPNSIPDTIPPLPVTVRFSDATDSNPTDPPTLYVAPWMVEIDVPAWLAPTVENLGLYLVAQEPDNTPEVLLANLSTLATEGKTEDGASVYRYIRTFGENGNFDELPTAGEIPEGFPIEYATGGLQPGAYSLTVRPVAAGDAAILGEARFQIAAANDAAPKAQVMANSGAARVLIPPNLENADSGTGAKNGTTITLLGQWTFGDTPWYLWESDPTDGERRRGWTRELAGETTILTIREEANFDDVPVIGPSVAQ